MLNSSSKILYDMDELIRILRDGHHSLVVANKDVLVFDGRGISDLYMLLTCRPECLRGASLADKVVGKGAAALMVLGGVNNVFAEIISDPALSLLHANKVSVSFGKKVSNIINRAGDGICPVEQLCIDCSSATECLPLITEFIQKMSVN